MNDLSFDKRTNLVWIDLEMTGLNAQVDSIVEIAVIITDGNLNIIHEGPSLVVHQTDAALAIMDPWVRDLHTKSGLLEAIARSPITVAQAEQQVLDVIQTYCMPRTGILCGNTIWQDRSFLVRYMPKITDYVHYRLVDVSSVKELLKRWYPGNPALDFKKRDTHRALIDIAESIQELKHYRKNFFIPLP